MMRLTLLLAVLIASIVPALAQRPPDVDAFLDAFFARNIDDLAKHLPPAVEKRISELNPAEKASLERELLLARNLEKEGGKVTRLEGSAVLVSMEEKNGDKEQGDILLDRRISDGYESMLLLKFRTKSDHTIDKESFIVWMKYEDSNWRVTELQGTSSSGSLQLDEATLLSSYVEPTASSNEASAIGSLHAYCSALTTYRATYSDRGLPDNLAALGGNESDASEHHAGLLHDAYTTPPYEMSGYRFAYSTTNGEDGPNYTITAQPIISGHTGNRNFYVDGSGIVRATSEAREATKDDDPI